MSILKFLRRHYRALKILDALFVAFSQHPFTLIWPEGSDKILGIEVLGEYFRFRLVEIAIRTKHISTPAEKLRQKRNWLLRQSKWDYKLTQRLKLVIRDIQGRAVHYEWSDTKKKPLEICLQSFLSALLTAAKELKIERGDRGTWRRQWDALRAHELMVIEKQMKSARKLELLRKSVNDWAEATTLREYLIRLRKAVNRLRTPQEREEGQKIIFWLRQELRSIDPILNLTG